MLGVGLRKLCSLDTFGNAFREKKTGRKSTPGGCQTGPPGGSKMACGRPPGGSFAPVGPNLAAKAAGKPCLGRSGGTFGTLVLLLEPSWGLLLGASWGSF